MKKILFAASEVVPFIKTGGLADVVGSLPKCFDKKNYDVRVILPKYACMAQKWKDMMEYITHFYMDFAGKNQYVGLLKIVYEGVTFYFIDSEYYFNGDAILNDSANIFRFTSSSSFSFIFSNFKMERIGAVLNLSPYTYFNNTFELFGGEKIPVGSNFVKYFDTYKIPITYSESNPSYSGQLKMADDNVYVGYIKGGTATWKQINNS